MQMNTIFMTKILNKETKFQDSSIRISSCETEQGAGSTYSTTEGTHVIERLQVYHIFLPTCKIKLIYLLDLFVYIKAV